MKKLIYSILLINLVVFSCTNEDDGMNNISDCPTDIVCTEIFVSLTFSPKDINNQPITLDSFYAQNLDNGNTYSTENNDFAQENSYIVVTDAQIGEINKAGTNIRFIGLKGDEIVVQQDFMIGHDCCHVIPLNGPFDGQ
ncbi:MAG: hypothetical protein ACJAVN_001998 [Roseivirga sp.]|jgi:hypothetical protein